MKATTMKALALKKLIDFLLFPLYILIKGQECCLLVVRRGFSLGYLFFALRGFYVSFVCRRFGCFFRP